MMLCDIELINQSKVHHILTTTKAQLSKFIKDKHKRGYVLAKIYFAGCWNITLVKKGHDVGFEFECPMGILNFYLCSFDDSQLVTDSTDRMFIYRTEIEG